MGRLHDYQGYLQVNLLDLLRLVLALALKRLGGGGVDPAQLEVAGEVDGVERAVGLSLEGLHVAVEVDHEVVPRALPEARAGRLHEEGPQLGLGSAGREDDPALGLRGAGRTLVRSLRTSSMFQERPG